ncbi:FAS1-like dehydratase domain-containing protein, partial [Stutzerimonas nitrititolerans]
MTDSALTAWIGRTQDVHDQLSRNLIQRIAATFGEPNPGHGEPLPPLWQWCFFQDTVAEAGLGQDGHPARGGFLPPAGDRNRMWAGGRLEFHEPLKVGGEASRTTTILDVEEKVGRTGALLFVTLRHDYSQDGRLAIREEQDIVYREPSPPKLSGSEPLPIGDWREAVEPTPTLLFRYSAVTFNGHRIHYDWPYVTETEGYPGLVVHGPLIAT